MVENNLHTVYRCTHKNSRKSGESTYVMCSNCDGLHFECNVYSRYTSAGIHGEDTIWGEKLILTENEYNALIENQNVRTKNNKVNEYLNTIEKIEKALNLKAKESMELDTDIIETALTNYCNKLKTELKELGYEG